MSLAMARVLLVEFAAAPPSGDAADAVSYVVRVRDEPAHRSKTQKNRQRAKALPDLVPDTGSDSFARALPEA